MAVSTTLYSQLKPGGLIVRGVTPSARQVGPLALSPRRICTPEERIQASYRDLLECVSDVEGKVVWTSLKDFLRSIVWWLQRPPKGGGPYQVVRAGLKIPEHAGEVFALLVSGEQTQQVDWIYACPPVQN